MNRKKIQIFLENNYLKFIELTRHVSVFFSFSLKTIYFVFHRVVVCSTEKIESYVRCQIMRKL